MKNLLRWAGAIALALMPSLAFAQAPVGRSIQAPAGYVPATAIYCDDGTGHAALCSFSGGPAGSSVVFSRDPYIATANGTGFNSGDHLAKVTSSTPTGGSPTTFWVNDTQGTVIGSPAPTSTSQLPLIIANATFGASQTGAWNVGIAGTVAVTGTFWQAKQPASMADGDNVTMGSKADAACTTNDTTPCSAIALWKELVTQYAKILTAYSVAGTSGTFGQGVQGMSGGVPLTVSGQVADGNAPGVYSLPVAGIDGGGLKRTFRTDANGNMQVGGIASNVVQVSATTDRGGLVGTTAVTLMAANPARRGWSVQNQSSSASCYVNGTGGATADYHSLAVPAGQYFEPDHHVSTGAISIVCTAASTPVYAREW